MARPRPVRKRPKRPSDNVTLCDKFFTGRFMKGARAAKRRNRKFPLLARVRTSIRFLSFELGNVNRERVEIVGVEYPENVADTLRAVQ